MHTFCFLAKRDNLLQVGLFLVSKQNARREKKSVCYNTNTLSIVYVLLSIVIAVVFLSHF